MRRLQGKSTFVTGAASGIGRAAALLYAQEGADVVILDIAEAEGEKTAQLIQDSGGSALFVATDVTSPESVAQAFDQGRSAFGKVDVLHNNAGGATTRDGSLLHTEIEEFWRVMSLDLLGTILCCRYAIPSMLEVQRGSIVNMSSVVSLIGVAGVDFYTAAKGGITALTRALALQHAPNNIRVNAIAPGVTATERILARVGGDLERLPLMKKQIVGAADPIDVAHAALFLASDEAKNVTGVVLPVDGGASAW